MIVNELPTFGLPNTTEIYCAQIPRHGSVQI